MLLGCISNCRTLSFPQRRESHDKPCVFTWDSRFRENDRKRQFEMHSAVISIWQLVDKALLLDYDNKNNPLLSRLPKCK